MKPSIVDRSLQWLPYLTALLLIVGSFRTPNAWAHEYWLAPLERRWQVGDTIQADIRNGEQMIGTPLPFLPEGLSRAGLISNKHRQPLRGEIGDYPAFQIESKEPGLHLLLLETTRRELLHDSLADFQTFLAEHNLEDRLAQHAQRGLPSAGIIEHYYRYCKALVRVDDDQADASAPSARAHDTALEPQNQRLELVTDADPMTQDTLIVFVLFDGQALANRQVELYHRDIEGTITRSARNSDANGLVRFDTGKPGEYLLNSVHLFPPSDPGSSAHWETVWTSLHFRKLG